MVLRKNIVFHEPKRVSDTEWQYPETGSMWARIPPEWRSPDEFLDWCKELNAKLDKKKRYRVSHSGLARTYSLLSICGSSSQGETFMRSESLRVIEIPDEVIVDVRGNLLEPVGIRNSEGVVKVMPRPTPVIPAPAATETTADTTATTAAAIDANIRRASGDANANTDTNTSANTSANKDITGAVDSTATTATVNTTTADTTEPTNNAPSSPVFLLSPTPPAVESIASTSPQPSASPTVPSPVVRPNDSVPAAPTAATMAGTAAAQAAVTAAATSQPSPATATGFQAINGGNRNPLSQQNSPQMGVLPQQQQQPQQLGQFQTTSDPAPNVNVKNIVLCSPYLRIDGQPALTRITHTLQMIPQHFASVGQFRDWIKQLFPSHYIASGMYGITLDPAQVSVDSFDTIAANLFPIKPAYRTAKNWYVYAYTPNAIPAIPQTIPNSAASLSSGQPRTAQQPMRNLQPQPQQQPLNPGGITVQSWNKMVELTRTNAEMWGKMDKRLKLVEVELANLKSKVVNLGSFEPRQEAADQHRMRLGNRMDQFHGMLNQMGVDFAHAVNSLQSLQNRMVRLEAGNSNNNNNNNGNGNNGSSSNAVVTSSKRSYPYEEEQLTKKRRDDHSHNISFKCENGFVPPTVSRMLKELNKFPAVSSLSPTSDITARFAVLDGKCVLLAGSKDKWEFGFGEEDVGGSNPFYVEASATSSAHASPRTTPRASISHPSAVADAGPSSSQSSPVVQNASVAQPSPINPMAHAHSMHAPQLRGPGGPAAPRVPSPLSVNTHVQSPTVPSPLVRSVHPQSPSAPAPTLTSAAAESVTVPVAGEAVPSVPVAALSQAAASGGPVQIPPPTNDSAPATPPTAANQELSHISPEPALAPVTVDAPASAAVESGSERASGRETVSAAERVIAERTSQAAASDRGSQAAASDRASQASASPVIGSATTDMDMRRNEARKQRQQLLEQEKRMSESITASLTSADISPAVAPIATPPRPPPQVDERTLERNRERAEEERLEREEREKRETEHREAQGRRKAAQKAQARAKAQLAAEQAARDAAREQARAAAEKKRVEAEEAARKARAEAEAERQREEEAENERRREQEAEDVRRKEQEEAGRRREQEARDAEAERRRVVEAAKSAREASSMLSKKSKKAHDAHDAAVDIINRLNDEDDVEQSGASQARNQRETTPVAPDAFSRPASPPAAAAAGPDADAATTTEPATEPAAAPASAKERAEKMRQLRTHQRKSVEPVKTEKRAPVDSDTGDKSDKPRKSLSDKSSEPLRKRSVDENRKRAETLGKRVEGAQKRLEGAKKKPDVTRKKVSNKGVSKPAVPATAKTGGMFERLKKAIPGLIPPPPPPPPPASASKKKSVKDKAKKADKTGVSSDSSLSDAIWIDISD